MHRIDYGDTVLTTATQSQDIQLYFLFTAHDQMRWETSTWSATAQHRVEGFLRVKYIDI